MEQSQNEILDVNLDNNAVTRRRKLLPWWIKVFAWIFITAAVLIPFGLLANAWFGLEYNIEIYGIGSHDGFSLLGIMLTAIFLLKGITAFALWTEKDWAIVAGQFDAVIGIIICIYVSFIYPIMDAVPGFNFSFRLELLILIPFLIKLEKISNDWKKLAHQNLIT